MSLFPTFRLLAAAATFTAVPVVARAAEPALAPAPVRWTVSSDGMFGPASASRVGAPALIDTAHGPALQFNGRGDGLELAENPLAGWPTFTLEILFHPDRDGPAEQRFFHVQADGSDARTLMETRVTPDGRWYLDGYLNSLGNKLTLIDPTLQHATDRWYWVALRYDGAKLATFVNGRKELEQPAPFRPMGTGRTSIGMRLNRVHWFKGAIREIRLSPSPVTDAQLSRITE